MKSISIFLAFIALSACAIVGCGGKEEPKKEEEKKHQPVPGIPGRVPVFTARRLPDSLPAQAKN